MRHFSLRPQPLNAEERPSAATPFRNFLSMCFSRATLPLGLSAASLAALLLLAPHPPARAESCFYDSGGRFSYNQGRIYSKKECTHLYLIRSRSASLSLDMFKGINNLENLTLDGYDLRRLPPGFFSRLGNLQGLHLKYNNPSSLPPDVFSGLNNLQDLSLAGSGLNRLSPNTFSGLSDLQRLNLSGNKLSSLPPDIFSRLNNLLDLALHGQRDGQSLTCLPRLPPGLEALSTDRFRINSIDSHNLPPCR